MDRSAFLDRVLERYASCYDIVRSESDTALAATAEFHEHGVGYMLTRKAEMWSADRNEYVWFYSVHELTAEVFDRCYAEAFAAGTEKVVPQEGHMSSAVVVVFLCDLAEKAALDKLRRTRYRKDFKFGLQGWMAVRMVAVTMEDGSVVANAEGRPERNFMESLLRPKKQGPVGKFFRRVKKLF